MTGSRSVIDFLGIFSLAQIVLSTIQVLLFCYSNGPEISTGRQHEHDINHLVAD